MIKPLKSVLTYYTKGFFTASGSLFLMNLGLGLALLIHAFEDVFKIK